MEKNNPKVINAWCSYDIANSVYNLIINTVLFPIYFKTVTEKQFGGEFINFLGLNIKNTVLYDYTLSAAYLIIVFSSPILSGIADYGGKRKRFMQFFSFMGASACFSFYWFTGDNIGMGIFLMVLGVVGFAGSLLFYNSFLPQIATPDQHDRVSAKGYAWGYTGSVLLLILNLVTIEKFEFFGFATKLDALRFSFLEVGVWWFLIAQIAFFYLKDHATENKITFKIIGKGYNELRQVVINLSHQVMTKRFLLAFFFYSMGVQTLMLMAIMFGTSELGIKGSKLIVTIVILQVVAIVGAMFFGYVSSWKGNKVSLISRVSLKSKKLFEAEFQKSSKFEIFRFFKRKVSFCVL